MYLCLTAEANLHLLKNGGSASLSSSWHHFTRTTFVFLYSKDRELPSTREITRKESRPHCVREARKNCPLPQWVKKYSFFHYFWAILSFKNRAVSVLKSPTNLFWSDMRVKASVNGSWARTPQRNKLWMCLSLYARLWECLCHSTGNTLSYSKTAQMCPQWHAESHIMLFKLTSFHIFEKLWVGKMIVIPLWWL